MKKHMKKGKPLTAYLARCKEKISKITAQSTKLFITLKKPDARSLSSKSKTT